MEPLARRDDKHGFRLRGVLVADVVAFGECMLEVGLTGPAQAALGYAGDTFNTAVYLRRLGRTVAYATALGAEDPFSDGMLRMMDEEGVDASLVRRAPGRLPGVYAIDRDGRGERRFFYWRSQSPARDYFHLADADVLRQAVTQAKLVYLSGVTLAIVGPEGRAVLGELLAAARQAGVAVALDPNHRSQLWESPEVARAAIEAVIPQCRYVSSGVADLKGLFGADGEAHSQAWAARGIETVIRAENHAVTVCAGGETVRFPPEPPVRALDTTGAGDAFNAGYLWARMEGRGPRDAVRVARRLANFVVQHIGAIIPRSVMLAAMPS